ncbi:hypothetical protein D0N73_08165 [Pseudomonas fluorescens]|nr:hypothetical protein D0N73_08165 [Pseudomonas fluorescens]
MSRDRREDRQDGGKGQCWRGALSIVPTLCVGMHPVTLCVTHAPGVNRDAERPRRRSHAERGNDQPPPSPLRIGDAMGW